MTGNTQKEYESAARVCRLLCALEQEGSMAMGEIAARLHVSAVTASHAVSALLASGLAVQGREYPCGTKRDRKIRLCDDFQLLILHIDERGLRTLSYCPATGACVRQSVSLCDAIPKEEAMLAALHGFLFSEKKLKNERIGVILADGIILPNSVEKALSDFSMATRTALVEGAILRVYPAESVLYVRYGDEPTMRLFSNGVPISAFRPHDELLKCWGDMADARIAELKKQIVRVFSFVTPDVVLLESDVGDVETLAHALQEAMDREQAGRIVTVEKMALCEREMLSRLRMAVAEQVISDAKRAKKSPTE